MAFPKRELIESVLSEMTEKKGCSDGSCETCKFQTYLSEEIPDVKRSINMMMVMATLSGPNLLLEVIIHLLLVGIKVGYAQAQSEKDVSTLEKMYENK